MACQEIEEIDAFVKENTLKETIREGKLVEWMPFLRRSKTDVPFERR